MNKNETIAFLSDHENGLVVIDITTVDNLKIIKTVETPGKSNGIAVSTDDDTVFIGDGPSYSL